MPRCWARQTAPPQTPSPTSSRSLPNERHLVTTPLETDPQAPASAEPGTSAAERRPLLDRRYLTGCAAGLLLGGALGVPGAYALLRIDAHVAGPYAPGPT